MQSLSVAAVQFANALGNVHANADALCTWVQQAAHEGANLVFFPECCLSGYTASDPDRHAIAASCAEVAQVEDAARAAGVAVGFGFIEKNAEGGKPFVAYRVFDGAAGVRLVYRKTHLGERESAFAPGDSLPVAKIAGVRIGVQLCWESHIPDIASTLRAKGAELLLTPYAMGKKAARRIASWDRYLAARAVDNGMFVVACNALFPKEDGTGVGGGIAAWGPKGALIASCDLPTEHLELIEIGGELPREAGGQGMCNISYFDRRRPELYMR